MQLRGSRVTWSVKGAHLVGSLTRGGAGEHIKDASALVTDHAVHQGTHLVGSLTVGGQVTGHSSIMVNNMDLVFSQSGGG